MNKSILYEPSNLSLLAYYVVPALKQRARSNREKNMVAEFEGFLKKVTLEGTLL